MPQDGSTALNGQGGTPASPQTARRPYTGLSRAPKRNAMLIEEARNKIKTSQILNRLNTHILSKTNVMTDSQVRAALGLLRKVIPDLANVELSAGGDGPVLIVTGILRPHEQLPAIEHAPQAKPLADNTEQPAQLATKDE